MIGDPLPIQYHLEIYEDSFQNDPTAVFRSNQPFLAFHKGDLIDPGMFENLLSTPPRTLFRVVDVLHRVWDIDDSHIGHQIGISIVATDWPE